MEEDLVIEHTREVDEAISPQRRFRSAWLAPQQALAQERGAQSARRLRVRSLRLSSNGCKPLAHGNAASHFKKESTHGEGIVRVRGRPNKCVSEKGKAVELGNGSR